MPYNITIGNEISYSILITGTEYKSDFELNRKNEDYTYGNC